VRWAEREPKKKLPNSLEELGNLLPELPNSLEKLGSSLFYLGVSFEELGSSLRELYISSGHLCISGRKMGYGRRYENGVQIGVLNARTPLQCRTSCLSMPVSPY